MYMKNIFFVILLLIVESNAFSQVITKVDLGVAGDVYALINDSVENALMLTGSFYTYRDTGIDLSVRDCTLMQNDSIFPNPAIRCGGVFNCAAFYNHELYYAGATPTWYSGNMVDGAVSYRDNAGKWSFIGFCDRFGDVRALTSDANLGVIAVGLFDSIGGIKAPMVGRWDGSQWHSYPPLLGVSYYNARAVAVYQGEIYVGGHLRTAVDTLENLARLVGQQWRSVGGGIPGVNAGVASLTVWNGKLIAAGHFWTADGNPGNNIAAWDGQQWSQLGDGLNGSVFEVDVYNGDLYAAGMFWDSSQTFASPLAHWNGTSWDFPISHCEVSVGHTIEAFNGELYLGGEFPTLCGDTMNNIVRYSPTTGIRPAPMGLRVQVSPNPAHEVVSLSGMATHGTTATLYNMAGQSVGSYTFSESRGSFSVAGLPAGVYALRLQSLRDAGDVASLKIVVQ